MRLFCFKISVIIILYLLNIFLVSCNSLPSDNNYNDEFNTVSDGDNHIMQDETATKDDVNVFFEKEDMPDESQLDDENQIDNDTETVDEITDPGASNDHDVVEQTSYVTHQIPGILQAEDFDNGGEGVGYHDINPENSGGEYRVNEGVDIGAHDSGFFVGWIEDGEWLEYTISSVQSGSYSIAINAASDANNSATVSVELDGVTLAQIDVQNTGGWRAWKAFTVPDIAVSGGTNKVLRLTMSGAYLNVDSIKFIDNCPDDPNKTEPGECGCGVEEGTCQEARWQFVVVGDSRGSDNGINESVLTHLVDAIIEENAEFVLFPGDLTTSGTQSQFQNWLATVKPLYDRGINVYAVRGNHDDSSLSAWNNVFSGDYAFPQNGPSGEKNLTYSKTHKNVFFMGIDNYSGSMEVNQSWVSQQFNNLDKNMFPHIFVFGHEPAFAADHSDTLDDHPSARNTFWESLKNIGCRSYFAGHDHFYDHARISDNDGDPSDDVHQFIVGSAGAPLYNFDGNYSGNNGGYTPKQQYFAKQYGYMVVEIDGNDVYMRFMERNGGNYVIADTFSYTVDTSGNNTNNGQSQHLALAPVADAYVDSSQPDSNFGSESVLLIDNDPNIYETFLRFSVPTLTADLMSAKLRLFVTNQSPDGPKLYLTENNWGEQTITYNNRPGSTSGVLYDFGQISTGWSEVNVTQAISASGDVSFILIPDDWDGADFDSKEGLNAPELIIDTGTN